MLRPGASSDCAAAAANSRSFREAEIPVANGIGTARALAAVYGDLVRRTGSLVSTECVGVERKSKRKLALTELSVSPCEGRWATSFRSVARRWPAAHAFRHAGAGGSIAFADTHARLGFVYVTNQLWPGGANHRDPRGTSLICAMYASL